MEHLEQIALPSPERQITACTEGLQPIIPAFHHFGPQLATQDEDQQLHPDPFLCTYDSTQGFLHQNRAIETLRRIPTDVTIAAIGLRLFAKIAQQHATTAHIRFAIALHQFQFLPIQLLLSALLHKMGKHLQVT